MMFPKSSFSIGVSIVLIITASSFAGSQMTQTNTEVNLVRNSTFAYCTNPGMPDFWGIPSRIPGEIEDWGSGRYYGVDSNQTCPVPGAKALKIFNPLTNLHLYVIAARYRDLPPLSNGNYTCSVYLKADRPGLPVTVGSGAGRALAIFNVTEQWQRYWVTTNLVGPGNIKPAFGLNGATGTVWIAAPQLEVGTNASPYQPAAFDKNLMVVSEPAPALLKERYTHTCPVIDRSESPRIDGLLNDECWRKAAHITGFINGTSGQSAAIKTEVHIIRDKDQLYVAFRCHESEMDKMMVGEKTRDGDVFKDNSVELFIRADPGADNYVHLACNAIGTQFDEMRPDWGSRWDAEWKCQCTQGEKEWTAEFAIPLGVLSSTVLADSWRINLCRNRRIQGSALENFSWTGTRNFRDLDQFGYLDHDSKGLSDFMAFNWDVKGPCWLKATNNTSTLGYLLSNSTQAGRDVTVAVDLSEAGESGQVWGNKCKVSSGPTPVIFSALPADINNKRVLLTMRDPDGKRILKQTLSKINRSMVSSYLSLSLSAGLEYSYYTNDPIARLLVSWQENKPVTLKVEVCPAAGNDEKRVMKTDCAMNGPAKRWIELPIESWPTGTYKIVITALEQGREIAGVHETLHKLPPCSYGTRIHYPTRSLSTDHSPWLAIVCHAQSFAEWQLRDIKNHGFNAIATSFKYEQGVARINAILDLCQTNDLKVVIWDGVSPSWSKELKNNFALLKTRKVEMVAKLKKHPAILAWIHTDEPSLHTWEKQFGYAESDLMEMYKAYKQEDPYRPAIMNWTDSWIGYGSYDATDILAVDHYPFRYPAVAPMKEMTSVISMINRAAAVVGKPVYFWLQAYGYNDRSREPTPDEMRCQVYLNLIYGTRILAYWEPIPAYPPTWEMIKHVNEEAQIIARDIFYAPDSKEIIPARNQGALHYTGWQVGNVLYVIAANQSYQSATLRLDLNTLCGQSAARGTVLFEPDKPRFENNVIQETFAPLQCRVYRLELSRGMKESRFFDVWRKLFPKQK